MKKIIILSILVFISVGMLSAMPPHPDLLDEYKRTGTLPLLEQRIAESARIGKDKSSQSFPRTGDQKVLVLMINFSDLDFDDGVGNPDFDGSTSTFYDGLFMNGPDDNGLSWRKYYQDMSNNQLNLDFDVYDVTAQVLNLNTLSYYGSNTSPNSDDAHPGQLVAQAIAAGNLAPSSIDYSDYDNDNDGYVDAVIVIHTGAGEETNAGTTNSIWSHRWTLSSSNYFNNGDSGYNSFAVDTNNDGVLEYDSVLIDDYAIQPEYVGTPGDSTIGVFVHEFGHVLGLPDLYDTGSVSDGIGSWGVMAGGSWAGPNGKGSQPVPLSAWSRNWLGWLDLDTVTPARIIAFAGFPWKNILRNTLILSLLSILILFALEKLNIMKKRKLFLLPAMLSSLIILSTCGQKGSLVQESLADIETSYTAKAIDLTLNEYIIAENKVVINDTWTEYLPGGGLVLYHIDNNLISSRYNSNSINDISLNGKLGVKVIEADENNRLLTDDSDYGSYTDPFYTGNVNYLVDYMPNYSDQLAFEMTNVSTLGSVMTFDIFVYE